MLTQVLRFGPGPRPWPQESPQGCGGGCPPVPRPRYRPMRAGGPWRCSGRLPRAGAASRGRTGGPSDGRSSGDQPGNRRAALPWEGSVIGASAALLTTKRRLGGRRFVASGQDRSSRFVGGGWSLRGGQAPTALRSSGGARPCTFLVHFLDCHSGFVWCLRGIPSSLRAGDRCCGATRAAVASLGGGAEVPRVMLGEA